MSSIMFFFVFLEGKKLATSSERSNDEDFVDQQNVYLPTKDCAFKSLLLEQMHSYKCRSGPFV